MGSAYCFVAVNSLCLIGPATLLICLQISYFVYRRASAEEKVKMLMTLRPFFRLFHEFSSGGAEEDHQLMSCTFQSAYITITTPCMNYMKWRREINETPGLEFLRLALQVPILYGCW